MFLPYQRTGLGQFLPWALLLRRLHSDSLVVRAQKSLEVTFLNPWLEHTTWGPTSLQSGLTSAHGTGCCERVNDFQEADLALCQVTLGALGNSLEPTFLPWETAAAPTVKSCAD